MPPAARREPARPDVLADPDSLRELVHEIKTPLNAIIGFAEIIEGQFLGPADRRYRERAAEIVAQARLLLGAIDDLDFAAKIHSSSRCGRRRATSAELLERARRLASRLGRRAPGRAGHRRPPHGADLPRSSPSSPTGCCSACARR